ncbi:TIGR03086 family metal-binding protein [Krasilnikovia sp. MM14-A1259]|uniref:TIGR03086 family metal-binding protein n=1 Tax=Krasilnikovia sp. MM14-A1259 TaxID=3373539 RepID=UPI00381D72C6
MTDRVPLDFDPSVRQLRALLLGVTDDDLTASTPCDRWSVGDLLDHLMVLSLAFTQVARKESGAPGTAVPAPEPSAVHLPSHWRSQLPALLEDLATAWKHPGAWAGTAQADGVTRPASELAAVAINELTVHGWDLARATGQDFAADPRILHALAEFLSPQRAADRAAATGAMTDLEDEPTLLAKVVGLTGRDPNWRPGGRRRRGREARDAA